MTSYLLDHVVPAAYSVLPKSMASPAATAMLISIALQESKCAARRQLGGPARGFWQFELGGLEGVRRHPSTQRPLEVALAGLCYPASLPAKDALVAIEHNDALACVFARLLLFTLPTAVRDREEPSEAWVQYLAAWRPGKPHPETWPGNYARAWALASPITETV